MQLPTDLTAAQRAALVQCLRIFADCGRAAGDESRMPSSVSALDGGDNNAKGATNRGIVSPSVGAMPARVNKRAKAG